MSPIEMFVQGEAPAPEPHPRGGRRRLGPGRRCRGKHRTHTLILGRAAAWARLPLRRRDGTGPGAPAAGSREPAGRPPPPPPPACCTLGSRPGPPRPREAPGCEPREAGAPHPLPAAGPAGSPPLLPGGPAPLSRPELCAGHRWARVAAQAPTP